MERTDLNLVFGGDEDLRKMCFVNEQNMSGIGFGLNGDNVIGNPVLVAVNLETESVVMLPEGNASFGTCRTSRHGADWLAACGLSEGIWHWFHRTDNKIISGPNDESWQEAAETVLRIGFIGPYEPITVEDRVIRLADQCEATRGCIPSVYTELREAFDGRSGKTPKSVFPAFLEMAVSSITGITEDLKVDERQLAAGDASKLLAARSLSGCVRHLRMARDAFSNHELLEASASVDFFVERLREAIKNPIVRSWLSQGLVDLAMTDED